MIGSHGDDRARGAVGDRPIDGDAGNDGLSGGDGATSMTGGDGGDILDGYIGDDALFGGGNDILRGLSGAQAVERGTGFDTVVFAGKGFGSDTSGVHSDLTGNLDSFGLIDDYARFGAIVTSVENVTGSAADDFIAGASNTEVLRGGKGDDMLFARLGTD